MAAREQGSFDSEIVHIKRTNNADVTEDELPQKYLRSDYDTFKPVFQKDGTVTKGNACGLNDGASTLLLAKRSRATELGLKVEALVIGTAITGW